MQHGRLKRAGSPGDAVLRRCASIGVVSARSDLHRSRYQRHDRERPRHDRLRPFELSRSRSRPVGDCRRHPRRTRNPNGCARMTTGTVAAMMRLARHPIWAEIGSPFARTAAWWADARTPKPEDAGTPRFVPDLALAFWALMDELALAAIRFRHRPRSPEEMTRIAAEVTDATALYARMSWLDDPASYHDTPNAPNDAAVRSTRGLGPRYEILSFRSGYEPRAAEPGRDRYLADEPNAT